MISTAAQSSPSLGPLRVASGAARRTEVKRVDGSAWRAVSSSGRPRTGCSRRMPRATGPRRCVAAGLNSRDTEMLCAVAAIEDELEIAASRATAWGPRSEGRVDRRGLRCSRRYPVAGRSRRRRASIASDSRRRTLSRLSSSRVRSELSRLTRTIVLDLPSLSWIRTAGRAVYAQRAIRHDGRSCRRADRRRP